MREIGIVQNVFGEYADVAIVRKTACGENCASCKGGCTPGEQIVRAKNTVAAKKNDRVAVELGSRKVVNAAFLAYIVPIVFLVLGTIAGERIFDSEWPGVVTGLVCMAVCFLIVHFISERKKEEYELAIVEVLHSSIAAQK